MWLAQQVEEWSVRPTTVGSTIISSSQFQRQTLINSIGIALLYECYMHVST